MSKLPSFIIIGAMKSATTSLQEQLVKQPGIFMSEPKEPNFFSDDDQYAKGIEWYTALFEPAPIGSLQGEASTQYTKLPTYPDTVARIKEHLPNARFIYVMRQPVDRLISHYIHEWSIGRYRCSLVEAIERYPELIAYGQYAMQLEPYFEAYGKGAVLSVFFDRLIQYSKPELERICSFIDYNGEAHWIREQHPSTVSSERIRRFPLYGALVGSSVATWLRRTFISPGIRDAIKRRLTMSNRPALCDRLRVELEALFDPDLARVGQLLSTELNCNNFKMVTAAESFGWDTING
ncbi:MAG: sulfotransferase [Candidatus Sedimenticola sp. (ex Thyasira tokunagai)]